MRQLSFLFVFEYRQRNKRTERQRDGVKYVMWIIQENHKTIFCPSKGLLWSYFKIWTGAHRRWTTGSVLSLCNVAHYSSEFPFQMVDSGKHCRLLLAFSSILQKAGPFDLTARGHGRFRLCGSSVRFKAMVSHNAVSVFGPAFCKIVIYSVLQHFSHTN